jgi:hypothetical protein
MNIRTRKFQVASRPSRKDKLIVNVQILQGIHVGEHLPGTIRNNGESKGLVHVIETGEVAEGCE